MISLFLFEEVSRLIASLYSVPSRGPGGPGAPVWWAGDPTTYLVGDMGTLTRTRDPRTNTARVFVGISAVNEAGLRAERRIHMTVPSPGTLAAAAAFR